MVPRLDITLQPPLRTHGDSRMRCGRCFLPLAETFQPMYRPSRRLFFVERVPRILYSLRVITQCSCRRRFRPAPLPELNQLLYAWAVVRCRCPIPLRGRDASFVITLLMRHFPEEMLPSARVRRAVFKGRQQLRPDMERQLRQLMLMTGMAPGVVRRENVVLPASKRQRAPRFDFWFNPVERAWICVGDDVTWDPPPGFTLRRLADAAYDAGMEIRPHLTPVERRRRRKYAAGGTTGTPDR